VLKGSEARELYLECYQLILWKQCHWLINVKGFPKELETVVRDLWGLRLGILQRIGDERNGYGSGTGTMMFSSTSEGENTDTDGTGGKSMGSRRSRKSAVSKERLPRLIETLGLCYLGILLLRLPTSLGEFYKWAACEEIMYARAVSRFVCFDEPWY
jgi:RNA polymerase I-specific transcription initiation factor RRN7